jgi:hypothetical protein
VRLSICRASSEVNRVHNFFTSNLLTGGKGTDLACMHGQEWQAQSRVCEDACVRLSHFVDDNRDRRHDGLSRLAQRRN